MTKATRPRKAELPTIDMNNTIILRGYLPDGYRVTNCYYVINKETGLITHAELHIVYKPQPKGPGVETIVEFWDKTCAPLTKAQKVLYGKE